MVLVLSAFVFNRFCLCVVQAIAFFIHAHYKELYIVYKMVDSVEDTSMLASADGNNSISLFSISTLQYMEVPECARVSSVKVIIKDIELIVRFNIL